MQRRMALATATVAALVTGTAGLAYAALTGANSHSSAPDGSPATPVDTVALSTSPPSSSMPPVVVTRDVVVDDVVVVPSAAPRQAPQQALAYPSPATPVSVSVEPQAEPTLASEPEHGEAEHGDSHGHGGDGGQGDD